MILPRALDCGCSELQIAGSAQLRHHSSVHLVLINEHETVAEAHSMWLIAFHELQSKNIHSRECIHLKQFVEFPCKQAQKALIAAVGRRCHRVST